MSNAADSVLLMVDLPRFHHHPQGWSPTQPAPAPSSHPSSIDKR
jgi:hypothetical protein